MTGTATLQNSSGTEVYVSDESARAGKPVWDLLRVGSETRASLSMAESGRPAWMIADVVERFRELAKAWREDTRHLSSIHEMVLHSAYQQIIGMGPAAVPLIIDELRHSPDHWFWALRAITGEDPVVASHRGDIRAMAQDWIRWYDERGFLW